MTERPLQIDATAAAAARDRATVTPDGRRLDRAIHGVVTHGPVNHVDHRGRVFEIYSGSDSDMWVDPIVYCYAFTVRAKQIKGWGLHEHKADRYTLIAGEVLTVLYDARVDSPTHGGSQLVPLTGQGVRQLLIPAGVWHLTVNLSLQESHLINHPTMPYAHGSPDRLMLPWDSPAIPVDISALLPRQFGLPTADS